MTAVDSYNGGGGVAGGGEDGGRGRGGGCRTEVKEGRPRQRDKS